MHPPIVASTMLRLATRRVEESIADSVMGAH